MFGRHDRFVATALAGICLEFLRHERGHRSLIEVGRDWLETVELDRL